MLAVADECRLDRLAARDEQGDVGVAEAERGQTLELASRGRASARGRGRSRRSGSSGRDRRRRATHRPARRRPAAKRLELLGLDREAGRRPVTAEALAGAPRHAAERGVEVEGDRAARSLPACLAARDEHDRPVVALDEPRRDDADHALVPAPRPRRRSPGGAAAPPARTRSARRPSAGCAPRPPGAPGSAPRARPRDASPHRRSSVRSSSSAVSGRPSRPAALIRGARRKPTAPASTVGRIDRGAAHQRPQPGLLRPRERSQAGDRERAVLVEQRDDVGDRGERHEVERGGGRRDGRRRAAPRASL